MSHRVLMPEDPNHLLQAQLVVLSGLNATHTHESVKRSMRETQTFSRPNGTMHGVLGSNRLLALPERLKRHAQVPKGAVAAAEVRSHHPRPAAHIHSVDSWFVKALKHRFLSHSEGVATPGGIGVSLGILPDSVIETLRDGLSVREL